MRRQRCRRTLVNPGRQMTRSQHYRSSKSASNCTTQGRQA
jgi:hypothetical protein